MKPKHRVMCPDCGRSKMLFESESKARNFIKWNGDDIDTNGGELRTYYCPACGGYHISSKPYKKTYDYNTENLIRAYKSNKEASKNFKTIAKGAELSEIEISLTVDEIKATMPRSPYMTRRFVADLIQSYLKVNNKDLSQHSVDTIRNKVYKYYNV